MRNNVLLRDGFIAYIRVGIILLAIACLLAIVYSSVLQPHAALADEPTGPVKTVIVKLDDTSAVTAQSSAGQAKQRSEIENANQSLNTVGGGYISKVRDYTNLPYAVYTVDAAGESALKASPLVASVTDDTILKPLTNTPIPTIGGSAVNGFSDGSNNFTGNGYAVAVVDSGVDKNHPALSGKVISEACFGANGDYSDVTVVSLCPGAATSSTAAGSGQDCTLAGCGHGTEVAGAAAMAHGAVDIDGDSTNEHLSGTAKNASIVAVQINVRLNEKAGTDYCGDGVGTLSSCALPMQSLYLAGLDYIATLSASKPIAAANLSIGSTTDFASSNSECNAFGGVSMFNTTAAVLKSHNIAPIVAAGNSGATPSYRNKVGAPACADQAIAVAATNITGTAVASYSNNGSLTDLLAPGGDYDGSNPDSLMWLPQNGTSSVTGTQGTSFAAPMVAGTYAVLREAHPNATVAQLTNILQSTGTNVTDARTGYTVGAKKLIQVDDALASAQAPGISSFTGPGGTVNEGTNITVNATVTHADSCSLDNGVGNVDVVSGAISASVPAKANYTLTCLSNLSDSTQQSLSLTLNAAPTAPSVQGSGNFANRTYTLNWSASADSDGIDEYRVYVNNSLVANLDASTRSYTITNLQIGQTYSVQVLAVDSLGAISTAGTINFSVATSGITTAGVPNTGIRMVQLVQNWQLISLGLGAVVIIGLLYRFQKLNTVARR